ARLTADACADLSSSAATATLVLLRNVGPVPRGASPLTAHLHCHNDYHYIGSCSHSVRMVYPWTMCACTCWTPEPSSSTGITCTGTPGPAARSGSLVTAS